MSEIGLVATAPTVYGIETFIFLLHYCYLAVATAPTVYGIETRSQRQMYRDRCLWLQQHLPFTVLKPGEVFTKNYFCNSVATAPTVYGIETLDNLKLNIDIKISVATAPTVYGIETTTEWLLLYLLLKVVATAPTVYGIETLLLLLFFQQWLRQLQQHLPFTVLKPVSY